MSSVIEKNKCTGCGVCENVCPVSCIKMKFDVEGFRYPEIEEKECIKCGRCEKLCPIINKISTYDGENAYAVINKDHEIRMNSSSGGVFSLLAKNILENNGIVFGACMDENGFVIHKSVESIENLDKLRGSKYAQSNMKNSYNLVKTYLQSGRKVLFTGTPCQIAGLRKYLGCEYENLICQDIICHGVPSPIVFKEYIDDFKRNYGKIKQVQFREKSTGWKEYSVNFSFDSGKIYRRYASEDMFMRGFLNNYFLRPSCHECQFKGEKRYGDITLADFWGINKILPDMDDNKGTSLVLINSYKAEIIWNAIQEENIVYQKVNRKESLINNRAAVVSSKENEKRKDFFDLMEAKGTLVALRKYCELKTYKRIYWHLKKYIKMILKK